MSEYTFDVFQQVIPHQVTPITIRPLSNLSGPLLSVCRQYQQRVLENSPPDGYTNHMYRTETRVTGQGGTVYFQSEVVLSTDRGNYGIVNTPVGPGIIASLALMAESESGDKLLAKVQVVSMQLHALSTTLYESLKATFPELFLDVVEKPVLEEKHRRLIALMAQEDLKLGEAAENLLICRDTANKHIAAAKKALGVKNTSSLIYKAAREGLI
ncbi:helix-turn-helix transcriptional regulator [Porticoccus sp. GXU_MW_L64]